MILFKLDHPDAKELAARAGVPHGKEFVRALHELEDEMQVSFTWLRGYKI